MKKSLLTKTLFTLFLAAPLLAGCGNKDNPTPTPTTCSHVDENPIDHKCDKCGEALTTCIDQNQDGKCDVCGANMPAPAVKHAISVSSSSKIVYSIDKNEAYEGEEVTLTIVEEKDNYEVTKVLVGGVEVKSDTKKYTFTMPDEDVEVKILAAIGSFAVRVSAPSGVSYSLDKEIAKPGDTVTLTITSLSAGLSVKSVEVNGTAVTSKDGKTYAFTMPSKVATVQIKCSVSGDIVIEGDIVASFAKEASGLFVARDVKANGESNYAKFNVLIGSGETKTKIKAVALDETRSFADITFIASSTREYEFQISNGYTYDFFYDENSLETPFFVQRKVVDVLPTGVSSLQNLLITGPSIRSEYAIYPTDYVGAYYKINDKSATSSGTVDVIQQEYEWKLYDNNTSFAVVTPTVEEEGDTMYVYKTYDTTNNLYKSVDTYGKYQGKKIINDDRYRIEQNNYGPVAGTYEVINEDDYGYAFKMNNRYAARNVRTSAHMPNYFLERDIMYSYRVGFGSDNGMNSYNIDIKSEKLASGFKVDVSSYGEYTKTAGASDDYAKVYTVNMSFDDRGALLTCRYTEYKNAGEAEWDFVNHKQITKGSLVKSITAEYTYGDKFAASSLAGDIGEFKLADYFVTTLNDKFVFYDEKTKEQTAAESGVSTVALNDDIRIVTDGALSKLMFNDDFYEPSTALDLWQYGPTASSDETVITREDNDNQNQMSAIAIGKANVTFGSHVEGVGATKTIEINVKAGALAKRFWLEDSYTRPTPTPITSSDSANIKAGGVYEFNMSVSPSEAALVYHPVSADESLLTITSADNAKTLVIDVSKANVTSNTSVIVTIEAEYEEGFGKSELTFTILPADVNPLGVWTAVETTVFPNTYLEFTDDLYEGEVEKGFEGAKKGVIHDDVYNDSKLISSDNYYFYYIYNMGNLSVKLYEIDMQEPGEYSTDPDDYALDFAYITKDNQYACFLAEYEYDSDYEMDWYYPILGGWNYLYPDVFEYTPFEKA